MRVAGYALAALANSAMAAATWRYGALLIQRGYQRTAWVMRAAAGLVAYRGVVFVFQASGAEVFDQAILPVLPVLFGLYAWAFLDGYQAMGRLSVAEHHAIERVQEAADRVARNGGRCDTG